MKKPGNSPRMASDDVHQATPALGWYTDQILFGENWADPSLSRRDRSLVTCSALITKSFQPQLISHAKRAIANGVTPSELAELVTHLTFYAGWPCGMSAARTLFDVLVSQGISIGDTPEHLPDGLPVCVTEDGVDAELAAQLDGFDALSDYTSRIVLNDLWERKALAPRDRSLATIVALITNGDLAQLSFHIRRGLTNGLTAQDLRAVVTHLAFYAGWPKVMSALPVLRVELSRN